MSDDEELVLEGLAAGPYFIGVVADEGTENLYDMSVLLE